MTDLFNVATDLGKAGVVGLALLMATVLAVGGFRRWYVFGPIHTAMLGEARTRAEAAERREATALELARAATANAEHAQEQAQRVLEVVERMEQRGRGRPY